MMAGYAERARMLGISRQALWAKENGYRSPGQRRGKPRGVPATHKDKGCELHSTCLDCPVAIEKCPHQ